jgi:hypothetical protein
MKMFQTVLNNKKLQFIIKPLQYLKYRVLLFLKHIDPSPEIIVMIDGGLGSQMWQYALGQGASVASGLPVSYDLSWYDDSCKDKLGINNRYFELETVFPQIKVRKAPMEKIKFYRRLYYKYNESSMKYIEPVYSSAAPRYLGAYYVNAKYIDQQGDNLRKLFAFGISSDEKNKAALDRIQSEQCAVALQIRRGDYVGSIYDVITPKYLRDGIEYILHRTPVAPVFFVFSNGIEWCREVLADINVNFVFMNINDNDNGSRDMFLMIHCHHFIISNSSFGWWPAWLSSRCPEKLVIVPNKWLRTENESDRYTMRADGWIAIDVDSL